LRRFTTCTVANAIETLKVRLRNEGFTDDTIEYLAGAPEPMVAHAVTVRIRGSSPPTDNHDYLESTQWWNYVLSVPEPRVVVIQDVDPQPGLGALVGEVHANILRALGCIGVVTNGSVRDLPALEKLQFHTFANRLAVSHAYSHIVEMSMGVEVGGLQINSGDLLHGDVHGIVSIPPGAESQITPIAEAMIQREKQIIDLCRTKTFSIEDLRDAVRAFRTVQH
jgi:regulator of RNase E activity RraA